MRSLLAAYRFLPFALFEPMAYYQKYARLVCCKIGEELDGSVLWVELGL